MPSMKCLVHANFASRPMAERLGAEDYSYIFLLNRFSEALASLGEVVRIDDPAEADVLHAASVAQGVRCVLFSFAPPYKTPMLKECPVVPVFAWEYPDIPEHVEEHCWRGDPRHDWRYPLALADRVIALSEHTVDAVKRSLGRTFPITAVPAPLSGIPTSWAPKAHPLVPLEGSLLDMEASLVDSWQLGLNAEGLDVAGEDDGTPHYPNDETLLPEPAWQKDNQTVPPEAQDEPGLAADELPTPPCGWEVPPAQPIRTRLRGVVYTSVLTPSAGRKNWEDLISAFCWAFRDRADATLVLKVSGKELARRHRDMLMLLTKLSPIKCRIIAIHGYIPADAYMNLLNATTYYVNTSLCEGLCLPLLEFLGHGVPAIAPDNTAMADYIDESLAFVLDSHPGSPTVWPHGDWNVNRTTFHQLDWESLLDAFTSSHELARQDRAGYDRMSRSAHRGITAYCGMHAVRSRLYAFLFEDQPLPPAFAVTPRAAAQARS